MFRVMKAMLAEFSYFMEKYFGKTSILWSIVFMAVCCAVIFITITRVIEYIVEERGNSGRQKVVHWSSESVKAAEFSSESGTEPKKTGELPKKKILKFKLYGLYTVYSALILLCSYSFNKLVLLTYTWDSKLQRVMSNFTYMLSFKSNRKLFFSALSLPDNVFNKNHVFNIALYLNDSQWNNIIEKLDSEKWYFEKVQKAIYEILHIGDYHLSLGVLYQGILSYIPIALLVLLGVILFVKNYKIDACVVVIISGVCLLYNFGTCIFVCISMYLGLLIKIWFGSLNLLGFKNNRTA